MQKFDLLRGRTKNKLRRMSAIAQGRAVLPLVQLGCLMRTEIQRLVHAMNVVWLLTWTRHQRLLGFNHKALMRIFRNLTTPLSYCKAIGPPAVSRLLWVSTVFSPFR